MPPAPVPGAGWSAADDDVLVKKSTGAGVNVMADASQLPLAPVLARCVAAVIDGLLLLSASDPLCVCARACHVRCACVPCHLAYIVQANLKRYVGGELCR